MPYRGTPQALTDLVGGQLDAFFADPFAAAPFLSGAQVKALAVTDTARLQTLPQVPTTAEAGHPNVQVISFAAAFAPAKTEPAIVERLNREINKVLQSPAGREFIQRMGAVPMVMTPGRVALLCRRRDPALGPTRRDGGDPEEVSGGRLANRRIVVTGAASGIGRRTAQLFADEGAALLLLDRDADALAAVAASTRGHCAGGRYHRRARCAARRPSAAPLRWEASTASSTPPAIMWRGSVLEVPVADWRRVIDVNLTGMYIVVRTCLPWLRQAGAATIVNLGSGQSLLPNSPNRTAYSASKGGVLNLSRALAAELAPAIRVNCVCPGLVDTPMAEGVRANVGNYALGRLAQPEEIARAILS